MKSYPKTIDRTFKNNLGRFFAITLIVMLGLAIISGLGALSPITRASVSNYLKKQNFSDIIVKSTTGSFSQSQIEELKLVDGVLKYQTVSSLDMQINDLNSRLVYMNFEENSVNTLELVSGRLPKAEDEIVVERQTMYMKSFDVGQTIDFMGRTFKIVGIVGSPLIYSKDYEPDIVNQDPLELVLYIDSSLTTLPLPTTDIYLLLEKEGGISFFSKEYKTFVSNFKEELETKLSFNTYSILTAEENKSYVVTETYTDKVNKISIVFPLFFIAVVVLVVLTTMSRLIEEERQIIGCYRTLGYSNFKVALKYIVFSFISCLLGCAVGMALGTFFIPSIIYPGFNTILFLPEMASYYNVMLGGLVSIGIIIAVCGITAIVSSKILK